MLRVLGLVALLCLTGCVTERRIATDLGPGPFDFGTASAEMNRKWSVGEVYVAAEQRGSAVLNNWAPARVQLEQRIRDTLSRHATPDRASSELVVDVDVRIIETRGTNGWVVPALITGVGVMAGGAALGVWATGGREGFLGGEMLGAVPGVALAGLFPAVGIQSTADIKLTFRRASDGVSVAEKRAQASWEGKHNVYFVEDQLARITAEGAGEIQKQLAVALQDGLRAAPRATALSQVTEP